MTAIGRETLGGEGFADQFMESTLFEIDLLTDHDPGWEHQWLPIPKGLRPKARGCEERATPG